VAVEVIARVLEDEADAVLARDLFGTDTPEIIADVLLSHLDASGCGAALAARFFQQSVGAVLGVDLDDGRAVVVKVFGPEVSSAHVHACCAAQAQLALEPERIAPAVIGHARSNGAQTLVTMELRDEGVFTDARAARYRRQMALTLVQLTERLGAQTLPMGIESRRPPTGALYPRSPGAVFDLDAPAGGAEPIDDVATRARALLDARAPGDFVIGHADWTAKNMRFDEESAGVTVVYDWDSLFHLEEAELAATAARGFGEVNEALAFLADFEEGRGRPFSVEERRRVYAHLIYAAAYSARCAHALTGEVATERLEAFARLL
jgi:hypothetical protein